MEGLKHSYPELVSTPRRMMVDDDFAILFRDKQRRDDAGSNPEGQVMPAKSFEVERIETKRFVAGVTSNLDKTKINFAEKIERLKSRAINVHKEQDRLLRNLVKYNNFVKEKRLKVEEGNKTYEAEKLFQETIHERINEKEHQRHLLLKAKDLLQTAVERRVPFRDYLQTVVQAECEDRNRYKDIGELMKRCETLVVTRDEARQTLSDLQDKIAHLQHDMTLFKEAQNERVLNLSSRQGSLQDALYHIQARKDSRQRLLSQAEQEEREKKLTISKIRLSILTLWQYANSKKVVLPGDRKHQSSAVPPDSLEAELETVLAHVEDLETVVLRVRKAENVAGYMSPLVSFSELRIDY